MAGLGWTGTSPFGLQATLRQQVQDRIAQEQQGFNNDITTRELALREQQAQAQEADRQAALAERTQGLRDETAAKAIPLPGENISPDDYARTYAGTSSAPLFNPQVSLPATQTAGAMPLDASQPSAAITSAAPQRLTGRMVSAGTPAMQVDQQQKQNEDSLANDPTTPPAMKQFLRARQALPKGENIPYQVITEPNGPTKAIPRPVPVAGPHGPIYQDPAAAIGQPVYERPQQAPTVTIQTVDDQGNPITRVMPKAEAVGQDFAARPSSQDAQHTRANKETLGTLDQLDQAIENAKDLIGPGEGRVSNVEQMAGNADPRIQALGVKMKAAKMQVDHAITGSVRAGASPLMLQQWDNILANKITPEGLKAGVQAMREIIGGGSSAPAGMIEATDPQGQIHHAPAGTALPAGWKLVGK
jgi:hypothetical protein